MVVNFICVQFSCQIPAVKWRSGVGYVSIEYSGGCALEVPTPAPALVALASRHYALGQLPADLLCLIRHMTHALHVLGLLINLRSTGTYQTCTRIYHYPAELFPGSRSHGPPTHHLLYNPYSTRCRAVDEPPCNWYLPRVHTRWHVRSPQSPDNLNQTYISNALL